MIRDTFLLWNVTRSEAVGADKRYVTKNIDPKTGKRRKKLGRL